MLSWSRNNDRRVVKWKLGIHTACSIPDAAKPPFAPGDSPTVLEKPATGLVVVADNRDGMKTQDFCRDRAIHTTAVVEEVLSLIHI